MPMFDNIGLLAGIFLLLVFAGIIFKVVPVDRRGIISWGGIWFLAFSIPPMLFRSPIADFGVEYYEYRTYLPMIGILFILGFLLRELTSYISFKKIIIISAPILFIYSIIAYMHMTDFSDPISFFTSAINASSKNAFAFAQRGEEYFNKGDLEGALLDFDNSIRISPNYSRAYFHKGALYNSMKDPIHAEQLFSVALNYDTLYPQINSLQEYAYFNLSSVKLNLKKFEEAIILLKKGVNKYQENGSLHINLGLAYYNIAKYDSALYEYDKGINLEPNISSYYNNRGLTKYHLNDNKGAINDFNRALDLNPNFLLAWGNRGRTKIDLKDYEGAINDLTKAISIKRDIATVWYLRGLAFSKLNKQVEAESDWAEARKFGFKDFVDENQKQK
jgi:tetratricopeptide (TPR) repeat protein